MQKTIVSDTSCLILLDKIRRLDLLKALFGKIIVTQLVADEFGKKLPDFIQIENPQNLTYQKDIRKLRRYRRSQRISTCHRKERVSFDYR